MNKNTIKHLKWKLLALLNPLCWIRQGAFNKKWDRWLRDELNAGVPMSGQDNYTVKIKGIEVWTANAPYANGSMWEGRVMRETTCSRATAMLLQSKARAAQKKYRRDQKLVREQALADKLAQAGITT